MVGTSRRCFSDPRLCARLASAQGEASYVNDLFCRRSRAVRVASGPAGEDAALELGHFIAGPFCARLLADLGADVIKVEPPGKGDPVRGWGGIRGGKSSIWWSVHGRNKRSVTLNMKSPLSQGALVRPGRAK